MSNEVVRNHSSAMRRDSTKKAFPKRKARAKLNFEEFATAAIAGSEPEETPTGMVGRTLMNTREYGLRLQAARAAKGYSQSQAGEKLGKSREALSLIERGKFSYPPTPEEMFAYEDLYEIPVLEQLEVLGYFTESQLHPEAGHQSVAEASLVRNFRRLHHPDDELVQRLVLSLA